MTFWSAGRLCALGIAGVGAWFGAESATAQGITTTAFATGLTRPIFVTHAPNDFRRVYIIEKRGFIRVVRDGTLLTTPFLDIDAVVMGGGSDSDERGLLGLAFHPNYQTNGKFYVNYTGVTGSGDTFVVEYVATGPDVAAPIVAPKVILTHDQPQTNHNGGWIGFGPDGYLYIAAGDGGNMNDEGTGHTEPNGNAQDITDNRLGKIHRVDVDGDDFPGDASRNYRIPPDNPFVGIAGDDEFWAIGLRNPWRPSFDRGTGDFYIADVGQGSREEINYEPFGFDGGRNYGWRCREGNLDTGYPNTSCAGLTLTDPIHVYSHSVGCSITGGYVYRGCAIPSMVGRYFFADYCAARIWTLQVVGGAATNVVERTTALDPPGTPSITAITSFGEDAYGELYICSQTGTVWKMIAATPVNDCDDNGINDDCEILDGSASDDDGDGRLNVCECVGDIDGNNQTNLTDLSMLLANFGLCVGSPGYNALTDLNGDGCTNLTDLSMLLAAFGCV